MTDAKIIGKHIRIYRELVELSQDELAEKLNVTRKAVSAWENGRACPRAYIVSKMCEIFNCTMSDILDEDVDTDFRIQLRGYREVKHMERAGQSSNLPSTSEFSHQDINSNEFVVIQLYRRLSPENQQKIILEMMNLINK